jgi:hypothetical protein
MTQELGKEHHHAFQRRELLPSQEVLPALISTQQPSSESQHSTDHADEAEEMELQARLINKAKKRAELIKAIARLGLTEQVALAAAETKSPSTSPLPASKQELQAPPNAGIARDTQGGRRKLRKKRGLPSLLAPKPEEPGKGGLSNSPPNQLKKENLGSKAKEAFHRLKGTLSPPSTPVRTEPPGTDPSVVDTQKKIELAREARGNLAAAATNYEAPPRSPSLKSPSSKEIGTQADLERKIELAKEAQRRLARVKTLGDLLNASNEMTQQCLLSSTREEILPPEIEMKVETEKKIELAREARWKEAHGTLPDDSSTNHESPKSADLRNEEPEPDYDHVSDTQKKIELAREARRRLEEEKAKGIPPALSSSPMQECKHWLRCDLCRICGES